MQVQDSDPLATSNQPTVQQGRDTPAPSPVDTGGGLFDSWNKWVDKPNNRAALMQFGIAMLQPVGMGETGVSHFANAVGAAGGAHEKVTEQERAQEAHESNIDTRETRARAAETSANAAETRALYAGQNTEQRQQIAQQGNLIKAFTAQANARKKYDDYALITPEKERLSYGDWVKTPEGRQSLLEGGLDPGAATTPGATPPAATTPAVSPTTGGRLTAKQVLNEPRMQPLLQSARTAMTSGDPNAVQRVRGQLQAVLGPSLPPEEMQLLLTQLGVR